LPWFNKQDFLHAHHHGATAGMFEHVSARKPWQAMRLFVASGDDDPRYHDEGSPYGPCITPCAWASLRVRVGIASRVASGCPRRSHRILEDAEGPWRKGVQLTQPGRSSSQAPPAQAGLVGSAPSCWSSPRRSRSTQRSTILSPATRTISMSRILNRLPVGGTPRNGPPVVIVQGAVRSDDAGERPFPCC
jgi:hypothetical protein